MSARRPPPWRLHPAADRIAPRFAAGSIRRRHLARPRDERRPHPAGCRPSVRAVTSRARPRDERRDGAHLIAPDVPRCALAPDVPRCAPPSTRAPAPHARTREGWGAWHHSGAPPTPRPPGVWWVVRRPTWGVARAFLLSREKPPIFPRKALQFSPTTIAGQIISRRPAPPIPVRGCRPRNAQYRAPPRTPCADAPCHPPAARPGTGGAAVTADLAPLVFSWRRGNGGSRRTVNSMQTWTCFRLPGTLRPETYTGQPSIQTCRAVHFAVSSWAMVRRGGSFRPHNLP